MVPIELELLGFLSYVKEKIDFTKLDSIVLIRGINSETSGGDESNNGSGKSGILDAIEWCLYGRVRGVFNKDLVKDDIIHLYEDGSQARKVRVGYIFEMDEGFYRVVREKALEGPSSLEVHFSKDRKTWDNYTLAAGVNKRTKKRETSLKRTQQKIEDILNANCDLFINSVFFEQKNTNTFATSTAGDKTNLLRLALYLDKWTDYSAVQKLKISDVESEIRSIESQLRGESKDSIQTQLGDLDNEKKDLEHGLSNLVLIVEDVEIERDTALKQLATAQSREETQKAIKSNYTAASARLTALNSERAVLKKKVRSWETRIESYDGGIIVAKEEIDGQNVQISRLSEEIEDIELDENDYSEASTKQLTQVATLKGEKKAVIGQRDTFQGDCPLNSSSCSRGSEEAHKTKLTMINGKLFKIARSIAIIEKAQKKLQKSILEQKRTGQHHDRLRRSIDSCETSIDRLKGVIKDNGKSLKLSESEAEVARIELENHDIKIHESELEYENLKAQYDKLDSLDLSELKSNLGEVNRSLTKAKGFLTKCESDIIRTSERIISLEEKVGDIEILEKSFNTLCDRKQVLAYSIKVLSKEIPHQLIEAALPEIEMLSQDYIKDLSLGRMNIELNTQKETKKKDKDTKENILRDEINMDLECDGVVKKYALCSGGEQTRGDLAIHFSYATFMLNRSGAKIRSLFLDEVSMALDTTGKKALLNLLKRLVNEIGFKKIFVISQDEKFNKLFDCVLTVKKTSDGSQVCVT